MHYQTRTYTHCLIILLLKSTLNFNIRLDLLIEEINTTLGHYSCLLRIQQTTKVGENHTVTSSKLLCRYNIVGIHGNGNRTRSIR